MESTEAGPRGRNVLVAVLVAAVLLEAYAAVLYRRAYGAELLALQVVRVLLAAGFAVFVYRGHFWARVLLGALLLMGALAGVALGLVAPGGAQLVLLLVALAQAVAGVVVLTAVGFSEFLAGRLS